MEDRMTMNMVVKYFAQCFVLFLFMGGIMIFASLKVRDDIDKLRKEQGKPIFFLGIAVRIWSYVNELVLFTLFIKISVVLVLGLLMYIFHLEKLAVIVTVVAILYIIVKFPWVSLKEVLKINDELLAN